MKISTESIEGFDGMSADEKVTALLGMEIPDPDYSGWVKKEVFDQKASEAAKYSKELKSRMSDEEKAKAESSKVMEELQEKYNTLLRDSTIANHTARYMSMPGYDEKLARESAEALFDGDMDKVFEIQQKANAQYEKKIRAELVKQDPRPSGAGSAGEAKDKNIELAASMGKARASAMKSSGDVLKKFTI